MSDIESPQLNTLLKREQESGETELPLCARLLKESLSRRIVRNPQYSVRAFARDVGVSAAFMSLVLKGKKKLSIERAQQVARLLKMDVSESDRFVRSVILSQALSKTQNRVARDILEKADATNDTDATFFEHLESDKLRTIEDWYHLAILDLTTTKGFESSPAWIARRLKLSPIVISDAIERLQRLGLLKRTANGTLKKTSRFVEFSAAGSDISVREFHRQVLGKNIEELNYFQPRDRNRRSMSAFVLAVNPKRMTEARKRIEQFQREIVCYLTQGDCTEVYQMGVYLCPLTVEFEGKASS